MSRIRENSRSAAITHTISWNGIVGGSTSRAQARMRIPSTTARNDRRGERAAPVPLEMPRIPGDVLDHQVAGAQTREWRRQRDQRHGTRERPESIRMRAPAPPPRNTTRPAPPGCPGRPPSMPCCARACRASEGQATRPTTASLARRQALRTPEGRRVGQGALVLQTDDEVRQAPPALRQPRGPRERRGRSWRESADRARATTRRCTPDRAAPTGRTPDRCGR